MRTYDGSIRLAAVSFKPGGRTYDYLCDSYDISASDKVIVNGYDGETEVTVSEVYEIKESELPIPLEKYKKVIRKVI